MTNHIHAAEDYAIWSSTDGYNVTNGSYHYADYGNFSTEAYGNLTENST
jgi:hypothetical protein